MTISFHQSGARGLILSIVRRTCSGTPPSRPIKIPNLIACTPACASAANGEATLEWMTDFDAKISPRMSRTISPEADLESCLSKAASKEMTTLIL
ncbi:Uncharacterized protein F383_17717 [Gossypium arboreum]|uniref:Uncharacterized protein n=1 Tax=Gossypium arboreum TaxID=29729 RepID=A0A0B0NJ13_GOSAR|nr:Uncharacterized protein F383_17717 [Gossypium arboreum]